MEPVLARTRAVLPDIAQAPFAELVASGLGRDVVVRGAIELAMTRLKADPLKLLDTPAGRVRGTDVPEPDQPARVQTHR